MSEPKEPTVVYSPEVLASMDADPDLAAAVRDFAAMARQAMQSVETGQHKSFEEAIEAITGHRPEPVFLDDDEDVP